MRLRPFTQDERSRVRALEAELRAACDRQDCDRARRVTAKLHSALKASGHEARLLKAKNWYFECVMESGDTTKAIAAFQQIRRRSSAYTRVHLEATALLAICFLRGFNEEALLAAAKDSGYEILDGEFVDKQAQQLAAHHSEHQLLEKIGQVTPDDAVKVLLRINRFAIEQLPHAEKKLLGPCPEQLQPAQVGRTFFVSVKRVIWRSLCDPESDIYKAWFGSGMKLVLNKAYIGRSISAALAGIGIGVKALAISVTALVIKAGLEVYCDRYKPSGVMIDMR